MWYYLISHVLVGIFYESTRQVTLQDPLRNPLWVSRYGDLIKTLTSISGALAIITTFINYSAMWAVVTFVEITIGIIIAQRLKYEIKVAMTLISTVGLPVIFGALWKFWYI